MVYMSCSLGLHANQYNLSPRDIFISTCTGLSGVPYAIRHWELSQTHGSEISLGHRIIAVLECLPLIGGITALLERIAVFVYDYFSRQAPVWSHDVEGQGVQTLENNPVTGALLD